MVHNIESVYRQSILSIQYRAEQSDFWLMSLLSCLAIKELIRSKKRGKETDFWQAKISLHSGKNLPSFQISKMLNGFWQPMEYFLENLFLKILYLLSRQL